MTYYRKAWEKLMASWWWWQWQ